MTNFVDTVFDTTQTGGVLKYNLTHADNTTEQVQMNIATPVQTQGTALNKVFFDTIQTDLTNLNNTKLNISNKATSADVIAGTDNTKYVTSLGLTSRIAKLSATGSSTSQTTSPKNTDVLDLQTYQGKTILATGQLYRGASGSGTYARLVLTDGTNTETIAETQSANQSYTYFFLTIDTTYKILKIETIASSTTNGSTIETKYYRLANWTKLYMWYNGTTQYDLTFEILN